MTVHHQNHTSCSIQIITKGRSRTTVNNVRQVKDIFRIKILVPVIWCLLGGSFGVLAGNVEGVDDSILFKMRWKDPLPSLDPLPPEFQDRDMIRMMSSDKEPYVCFVPRHLEVKASEATTRGYDGPTPLELLEPLLINRVCRYK
ncbi:endoplasmic reticulum lectin 1-like, partial [Tropilaelaps mercedesae]